MLILEKLLTDKCEELTNTELKNLINDLERIVQEEGFVDVYFKRYCMSSGFGYYIMHKDYDNFLYATGIGGSNVKKFQSLVYGYENYVKAKPEMYK